MTLTATVTHTTKEDSWGYTVHHYQINLSNGISAKRQATGGAQGVAFHLDYPRKTTASKDIRRLNSQIKTKRSELVKWRSRMGR